MSDNFQATRWGYVSVDPDDAPSEHELFAERLREIWDNASAAQRKTISHERFALGIRSKVYRSLTDTEELVQAAIYESLRNSLADEAARDREYDRMLAEDDARYWAGAGDDDLPY
jgi:hypothetical protein